MTLNPRTTYIRGGNSGFDCNFTRRGIFANCGCVSLRFSQSLVVKKAAKATATATTTIEQLERRHYSQTTYPFRTPGLLLHIYSPVERAQIRLHFEPWYPRFAPYDPNLRENPNQN